MTVKSYINSIETAVPENDIHDSFISFAPQLLKNDRDRALFQRMVNRSQIEHRYSFLQPPSNPNSTNTSDFYPIGNFPDTATRMESYKDNAFTLARQALDKVNLNKHKDTITHIIVTSCTGFYAPGLDLEIVGHYGLKPSIERTVIGFMGCYAAINALKSANHIVRSQPNAQVLILNLELCTLHFQEHEDLQRVLSFLLFADGCTASIISAQPKGLEIKSFHADIFPDSADQITWDIGPLGFDMILLGEVPKTIALGLPSRIDTILNGDKVTDIDHWAIHPGGRSVLDAVEKGASLAPNCLEASRDVLRRYGNMSSATVMFVLYEIMNNNTAPSGKGCAMAFGPGLTVETMLFDIV